MHQQSNTEKELMDWFDRQEKDAKWRISAYMINTGRPVAEALRFLKALDERAHRIHLVHPGNSKRH